MSDETIVCSQCGAVNDPGANYCYQCGANLAVQRATAAQPAPSEPAPPVPPSPAPAQEAAAATPSASEFSKPESSQPVSQAPPAPAPEATLPASGIPTEPPPAEPSPAASTGAEPGAASPAPSPAEASSRTGASPEWPFEVPAHQEESAQPVSPPPPSSPAAWTGQASGSQPLSENVTSSARYIVLAGIGLLVLSCLWVFLSIGTHLQARFGIFCLAPLGLILLVVGLFLMLQRGPNRHP